MDWATIGTFVSAFAALLTALATFFLWRVTNILAVETRRMADTASQAHIVATLLPNQRSMRHFDLHVDNTGNATAYDITVSFDPPLESQFSNREGGAVPLQRVSVLKPGQSISSFLSDCSYLEGKHFKVTTSWKPNPKSSVREENSYSINMADQDGMSRLGDDPMLEMAKHLKKLQENIGQITSGQKRIGANIYVASDRARERKADERRFREFNKANDIK